MFQRQPGTTQTNNTTQQRATPMIERNLASVPNDDCFVLRAGSNRGKCRANVGCPSNIPNPIGVFLQRKLDARRCARSIHCEHWGKRMTQGSCHECMVPKKLRTPSPPPPLPGEWIFGCRETTQLHNNNPHNKPQTCCLLSMVLLLHTALLTTRSDKALCARCAGPAFAMVGTAGAHDLRRSHHNCGWRERKSRTAKCEVPYALA